MFLIGCLDVIKLLLFFNDVLSICIYSDCDKDIVNLIS